MRPGSWATDERRATLPGPGLADPGVAFEAISPTKANIDPITSLNEYKETEKFISNEPNRLREVIVKQYPSMSDR